MQMQTEELQLEKAIELVAPGLQIRAHLLFLSLEYPKWKIARRVLSIFDFHLLSCYPTTSLKHRCEKNQNGDLKRDLHT